MKSRKAKKTPAYSLGIELYGPDRGHVELLAQTLITGGKGRGLEVFGPYPKTEVRAFPNTDGGGAGKRRRCFVRSIRLTGVKADDIRWLDGMMMPESVHLSMSVSHVETGTIKKLDAPGAFDHQQVTP